MSNTLKINGHEIEPPISVTITARNQEPERFNFAVRLKSLESVCDAPIFYFEFKSEEAARKAIMALFGPFNDYIRKGATDATSKS